MLFLLKEKIKFFFFPLQAVIIIEVIGAIIPGDMRDLLLTTKSKDKTRKKKKNGKIVHQQ